MEKADQLGRRAKFPVQTSDGVTVAVRPEKVHVEWQSPGQAANAIIGRVDAEAYFGDRSHYFVTVPPDVAAMLAAID
jgi:TOBE domain